MTTNMSRRAAMASSLAALSLLPGAAKAAVPSVDAENDPMVQAVRAYMKAMNRPEWKAEHDHDLPWLREGLRAADELLLAAEVTSLAGVAAALEYMTDHLEANDHDEYTEHCLTASLRYLAERDNG